MTGLVRPSDAKATRAAQRDIGRGAGMQHDRARGHGGRRTDVAGGGVDLAEQVGDGAIHRNVGGVVGAARGSECDGGAVDDDGVAHREVDADRVGGRRAAQRGAAGDRHGILAVDLQPGPAVVAERRRLGAGNLRIGAEIGGAQQFRTRHRAVVLGGQRIARQIGAIADLGGGLRRQEVVLEFQDARRAAGRVAGGGIDRHALQIVAGAVHQIAVLVERKVAAPGVIVDAGEDRVVVAGRAQFCTAKKPSPLIAM